MDSTLSKHFAEYEGTPRERHTQRHDRDRVRRDKENKKKEKNCFSKEENTVTKICQNGIKSITSTICPRSSDPFCIVTYYI